METGEIEASVDVDESVTFVDYDSSASEQKCQDSKSVQAEREMPCAPQAMTANKPNNPSITHSIFLYPQ